MRCRLSYRQSLRLQQSLTNFSICTSPGAFLVNVLPWLKYVPPWVPGAGFKRIAAQFRKTCDDLADIPLAWVQEQMVRPPYVIKISAQGFLSNWVRPRVLLRPRIRVSRFWRKTSRKRGCLRLSGVQPLFTQVLAYYLRRALDNVSPVYIFTAGSDTVRA